MPIKKLKVSFDIDAQMFAAMLTHGDMNIEVYGEDEVPPPRVTHTEPLQLEDKSMKRVILRAMKDKPKMSLNEIRIVIVAAEYSAKSLNGQIHLMQKDRLIKRAGYGVYAITKKGLDHGA